MTIIEKLESLGIKKYVGINEGVTYDATSNNELHLLDLFDNEGQMVAHTLTVGLSESQILDRAQTLLRWSKE